LFFLSLTLTGSFIIIEINLHVMRSAPAITHIIESWTWFFFFLGVQKREPMKKEKGRKEWLCVWKCGNGCFSKYFLFRNILK
jgi:hypothetical protein